MKLWFRGDNSRALCEKCQTLVSTTFGYHDVPFSDGIGLAKNIMAATCDTCGTIVSIPPQSTPAIRTTRNTATEALEFNLEAPFIDIIDAAALRLDTYADPSYRKNLITIFVRCMSNDEGIAQLKENVRLQQPRWKDWNDTPRKRLSFKVTPNFRAEFEALAQRCQLNKTRLIQAICMEVEREIVTPQELAIRADLQGAMAALAA
jgi:hypothetical protein